MDRFKQERLDAFYAYQEQALSEWIDKAEHWEVYSDDMRHMRCRECHQNIYFICDPSGNEFLYSHGEVMALKIAHIRQVHSGQREAEILGDTIRGHVDGIGTGLAYRHVHQGGDLGGVEHSQEGNRE